MCLQSQQLKPFVAKKDLKVFKVLNKEFDEYKTPFQGKEVELGSLMIADDKRYNKFDLGDKGHQCQLTINGGYIHSVYRNVMEYNDKGRVCVIAYIPKGTEYYVGVELFDVCSKQLKLTNNVVNFSDAELTKEEIMDILSPICDSIDKNEVCSGWMVKSDKSFIHPFEYTDSMKDDIIGVVGDIINGKTIVVALDETKCAWCKEGEKVKSMPAVDSDKNAYNDFKGKEYTNIIKNCDTYQENNGYYPAFYFCLKYETKGTQKGDWYLPSTGEQHRMYNQHRDAINISLFIMSKELIKNSFYWASAECSSSGAWSCYTYYAGIGSWGNKWNNGYVRPSFAIGA